MSKLVLRFELPWDSEPSDRMFLAFADACAMGCVLELKYRLLADMRPALRPAAFEPKLVDVEEAIIREYASELTTGEPEILTAARQLRNKVLHCSFHEAHQKLQQMGAPVSLGAVFQVDLANGRSVAVGEEDKSQRRVFGWLLASSSPNGLFAQAHAKFAETIALVNRLLALG